MTATERGTSPATDATPPINFGLFDDKCSDLGADDETARADLIEVDRTTLWRWRAGRQTPSLDAAKRIAKKLGITVEELTGDAA